MSGARIAVTLTNPLHSPDPPTAQLKNRLYLAAVQRYGGDPVPLDERTRVASRDAVFASMDGLLITGGADIDPARYREARAGAHATDGGRDALDAAAFEAATDGAVPILGICRGLQAINVFFGGRLVQHLEQHESPAYPARAAEAAHHPLHLLAASRLRSILDDADELEVNSFHHQGVAPAGLAPGLRASGLTSHGGVELIEALEATDDDRWLFGVQCHPERPEVTPAAFGQLWQAFIAAAAAFAAARSPRPSRKRPVPAANAPSPAPPD